MMNSILAIGALSLFAICGGVLAGVWLAPRLPAKHLSGETGTAVSVCMAVVGTLAALVLGLMVNSANASFNARVSAIDALADGVVMLNRVLISFGPETVPIRNQLVDYARAKTEELEHPGGGQFDVGIDTLRRLEAINDAVLALAPTSERLRHIQKRAIAIMEDMMDARWNLVESRKLVMPAPFLVILVGWLTLLFCSFGLFAPKNATVVTFLLLAAVAISGCILLILDLGSPTQGIIRPSLEPFHRAMEVLRISLSTLGPDLHAAA